MTSRVSFKMEVVWHLIAYGPVQHRGSLLWSICFWEKLLEESEKTNIKEQETNYKLHSVFVHQNLYFLLHSSLWQITSDAKSRKLPLKTPVQIEMKSKDSNFSDLPFYTSQTEVSTRVPCVVQDYISTVVIWPGRSLTLEQKQQWSVLALLFTVAYISNSAVLSWNSMIH